MIPLKVLKYVRVTIQIFMSMLVRFFSILHLTILSKQIQDNIRLNLFLNTDLKNEPNPNEILKIFDRLFLNLVDFLQLMN